MRNTSRNAAILHFISAGFSSQNCTRAAHSSGPPKSHYSKPSIVLPVENGWPVGQLSPDKPRAWPFDPVAFSVLPITNRYKSKDHAKIKFRSKEQSGDGTWFGYESTRTHKDAPPAKLKCEYRPIGAKYPAAPNKLEHFLTARYWLYSASPKGKIYRGEIDHLPWELSDAQVLVSENTMLDGLGIDTRDQQPVLHFVSQTQAKAWLLNAVA